VSVVLCKLVAASGGPYLKLKPASC